MKKLLTLLAFAFFLTPTFSQHQNAWELFEKVKFENTFVKDYGMFIPWPKFSESDRSWDGKEVTITGYIIPTAEASGFEGLILSKYPYAMCFFCGEAGIESVAELRMKEELDDWKMDKPYVFKGKLMLNDTDFENLNFILVEVELMDL